jgi:hypothetical protein
LSSAGFTKPEDVVRWLGAVQAQEYPGAKWSLALRMRRASNAAVERAFGEGRILRTHILRPTWHFVCPADIHWMLALTAPRVRARMAPYHRHFGIDAPMIRRSTKAIAAALGVGVQLTRQELRAVLEKAGVAVAGVQPLAHLVMHAELDGVICSGALRDRQFTYALLDERVPAANTLSRGEALGELTHRYFTSHGPAQVRDFVWWSGLTTHDARAGLEMAGRHLAAETIDGKTYWFSSSMRAPVRPDRVAHLLPVYDEYLIGYTDRSAALDAALWKRIAGRDPFGAPIALDGRVVGGWKRTRMADRVSLVLDIPVRLTKADERLVDDAAHRFAAFVGADAAIVRR